MVGRVGFEPTTFLVSRLYRPLASPFAYLPIIGVRHRTRTYTRFHATDNLANCSLTN